LTTEIILDTDFLSALLKIHRLHLVRDFYGANTLVVPAAVSAELSRTPLLHELVQIPWIRIESPDETQSPAFSEDLHRLGPGEREALTLASQRGALLLTNDSLARRAARRIGVNAVNIPAFLLSCKDLGFLDRSGIGDIVHDLREMDRYSFRKDILDLLLS
jgi:predicted nucleic acid-binding protein